MRQKFAALVFATLMVLALSSTALAENIVGGF